MKTIEEKKLMVSQSALAINSIAGDAQVCCDCKEKTNNVFTAADLWNIRRRTKATIIRKTFIQ